ncbi:hypothetical protein BDZ45DRAFT_656261 [Acephala macrosclerotiorum]|nr:hypothetical protein BDZ45DRAFT_656261 [Acephala macrosclerotiorum]
MPYLKTAQEWLTQSTLLLQARPSTTRITSKYTITSKASNNSKLKPKLATDSTTTTPSLPPPATLTLKTYDPASGVTLKYTTNKAAEVGRLIQILGRLARPMSGLPEVKEDVPLLGAEIKVEEGSGPGTPALESVPAVQGGGKAGGQQGGQGGKKGKKKGKK